MAKKCLILLIFMAFVTGGAFAQSRIGYGIGVSVGNDFAGGVELLSEYGTEGGTEMPYLGFGVYLYLDINYAEFSVGIGSGNLGIVPTGVFINEMNIYKLTTNSLYVSALGKYPIKLNNSLTIFPALGFDYNIIISLKQGNTTYTNASDFNTFWINGGFGLDFSYDNSFNYIRLTALYGIRLPSIYEIDDVTGMNMLLHGSEYYADTRLGHGFTIKLSYGF